MGAIELAGGEFFAPVASSVIDQLLAQYRERLGKIDQVVGLFGGDLGGIVGYFVSGNACQGRGYSSLSAESIFRREGAVAALNAGYWSKLLGLTDVLDLMPHARRDEWNQSIHDMTTPDFVEGTVRPTLEHLLSSRQKFFAERVDGIFRGLSGEHVTNSPMGFGKRMIIAGVLGWGGYASNSTTGLINDLRCVLARFMGRDEPKHYASTRLVKALQEQWGKWVTVDGGALRIRLYKKGTAHLEVHPDMSWRLNLVLSSMHPLAIPAEHRAPPKRKAKDVQLLMRPLPFQVLEELANVRIRAGNTVDLAFGGVKENKGSRAEAGRVLERIGGVRTGDWSYAFDYYPHKVITEVIVSGCLPDQKAYQFYPTPETVARAAIEAAEIGPRDRCLEPSAGQGGLADHMPKDRTLCVEVSELHCQVLAAKGHSVIREDFLVWNGGQFDRIVMNPPFSEGRWQAHLSHAATLLRPGGRLVAVLPASARGKPVLPGFSLSWSRDYADEFAGTSISVVLLTADKENT